MLEQNICALPAPGVADILHPNIDPEEYTLYIIQSQYRPGVEQSNVMKCVEGSLKVQRSGEVRPDKVK